MSYKGFVVSKKAATDLENIWLFTLKNWSAAQADKYIKDIFATINKLCT